MPRSPAQPDPIVRLTDDPARRTHPPSQRGTHVSMHLHPPYVMGIWCATARFLGSHRPRQPVRLTAHVDMARNRQRLQVYNRNIVVRTAGDKGSRPVRIHQEPRRSMTDGHPLELLPRCRIVNH